MGEQEGRFGTVPAPVSAVRSSSCTRGWEKSGQQSPDNPKGVTEKGTRAVGAQAKMVSSRRFLVRMVPGLCCASGWLASSGGQEDTGLSRIACFRS